MLKIHIKRVLLTFGLLSAFEHLNFFRLQLKHRKRNRSFVKTHPEVQLPPDFYMYETFNLDYESYFKGGRTTAKWILDHARPYITLENISILDWGCGPGRVLRHLNDLTTHCHIYGSDYNIDYVNWCTQHLTNVTIKKNELAPPLAYPNDFFDLIYGISIFTHLTKEMHQQWIKELYRVTNHEGIVLVTTHGQAFFNKLTPKEQLSFNRGELVEHEYKVEGNRLFSSYQNPIFFKALCEENGFAIAAHITGKTYANGKPAQDLWILQKN